jgi:hypothetical protein
MSVQHTHKHMVGYFVKEEIDTSQVYSMPDCNSLMSLLLFLLLGIVTHWV